MINRSIDGGERQAPPASVLKRLSGRVENLLETHGGPGRIPAFEGLRGYAVLLVFLVHQHTLFGDYLPASLFQLSLFTHTVGHSGVDVFFLLSGFLIYGHLFERNPKYFSYLGRRARRIYPTFLAVFTLYVIVFLTVPSISKLPAAATPSIIYLGQNLLFIPGIADIPPLITVAWSLSYEVLFYLTIPLLLGFTGMRRWPRRRRVALILVLIAAYTVAYASFTLPHVRLGMFLYGMLLYEATDSHVFDRLLSRRVELACILLYAAVAFSLACVHIGSDPVIHIAPPNLTSIVWTTLLAIALCPMALCIFSFRGALQAVFAYRPIRLVGNMSYSYFLVHGVVLKGIAEVAHFWGAPAPSLVIYLALLPVNLILTFLVALSLYALVEKPFSLTPASKRGMAVGRAVNAATTLVVVLPVITRNAHVY